MKQTPARVISRVFAGTFLFYSAALALAQTTEGHASNSKVRAEPDAEAEAGLYDVSHLLQPIREKHDLAGLAAVVVSGEYVEASGADGVRRRGSQSKITSSDRFHLGSCTKSMTATLVATLVEEGKLSWSTTIGEVFEDLGERVRPEWKAVTLEQLLTHRAGAPAELDADGLWSRLLEREGTPREQRMELVRGVLGREPESEPGTKFLYSNAGFAIAGAMAEKVTDKAWEDLTRERIFEPLGMKSAGFGAPGTKEKLDEPLGHTGGGTPVELGPHDDNPPAIGPAGTVHASLEDWAKYVALHLQGDRSATGRSVRKGAKLLKPETFARMHTAPDGEGTKYAMGWVILDREWGGGRVLMHNGSNTMWYCVVWMAPQKDFAVLAATNQGGDKAAKACDEAAAALIQNHLGGKK